MFEDVSRPQKVFYDAEKFLRKRQISDALEAYHIAESFGYEADACAGARWLCYMLLGCYSDAWRESRAIEGRGRFDPHRFWDGKSLASRRVMVRCLHGLGDTIQYARYLPLIRQTASCVILQAQPALKDLMSRSSLADEVITWNESEPAWDTQIEIAEIPRIFETTTSTIPQRIPYVHAPSAPLDMAPHRRHVGIVWASGAYNPERCVPLVQIVRLFDTPGCEFFSLQAGEERLELGQCVQGVRDAHCPDVLAAASRLVNLDLLITADTMTAHLAGALGLPVWIMLPFEADWRWMLDRADSPWYPTARLFRQPIPGDWKAVIDELRSALIAAAALAR